MFLSERAVFRLTVLPAAFSPLSNLADLVILSLSRLSESVLSLLGDVRFPGSLLFRLGVYQDRGYIKSILKRGNVKRRDAEITPADDVPWCLRRQRTCRIGSHPGWRELKDADCAVPGIDLRCCLQCCSANLSRS